METFKEQTAAEIRRLPLTLGKLAGAIIAVIAFAWAVGITTRRPDIGFLDAMPLIVAGLFGLVMFIAFEVAGRRHQRRHAQPRPTETKTTRHSLISWIILLALAGLFILATLVLTAS